MNEKLTFSV